jgi:hypothetical protein
MTIPSPPIAGIIAIEPLPVGADWGGGIDDSSLGALLESYAHAPSLAEDAQPAARRIVSSTRWRIASETSEGPAIQADLLRLAAQLEDEYRAWSR